MVCVGSQLEVPIRWRGSAWRRPKKLLPKRRPRQEEVCFRGSGATCSTRIATAHPPHELIFRLGSPTEVPLGAPKVQEERASSVIRRGGDGHLAYPP